MWINCCGGDVSGLTINPSTVIAYTVMYVHKAAVSSDQRYSSRVSVNLVDSRNANVYLKLFGDAHTDTNSSYLTSGRKKISTSNNVRDVLVISPQISSAGK